MKGIDQFSFFQYPSNQDRGLPFWSWNCKVTEALIDEQLDMFKKMGFGGVTIHARTGLDTEYLGKEYMRLTKYAVEKCKEKGLICWLYDDDRFPSGAADGLVTKDWHFRQRCLLLTEQERPGFLQDQAAFDRALDAGEHPRGWYAASYAVQEGKARRLKAGEAVRSGERLRFGYVMLLEGEDWFQGETYADVMNPQAVRRFIDSTHEAYFRLLGGDFGSAVPAIFTDEPRMETRTNSHPKRLKDAASLDDVIIPWSDSLRERLKKQGMDILDLVPALVWELPECSFARYHFRNAASEQFVSSFLDQIGVWCREHRILMTGHVLSEDTLSAQAASLGDCMRCYRSMDVPGIDVLCDDRQFLAAKQAVSVAHQYGRSGVASELYGVTEWNCDFKTFKLQGDWQAALGINRRVPHLSWMSMEGEAKRDWPGSIFYQSPYWKEFSVLEDSFARLNTALTRGIPLIDLAVLHPVESMWLHLGNERDSQAVQRAMDEKFDQLVSRLLLSFHDFDFISESLLPDQKPFCDQDGLHVGKMVYRTVIVPEMETIRGTTLNALEQFRKQGGRLIFAGDIPGLVDALPSEKGKHLAELCERAADWEDLVRRLESPIAVKTAQGKSADNLLCQRRQEEEGEWLFLCHAYPRESCAEEHYYITLSGTYAPVRFDPMTGETAPLAARYEDGCTIISWCAYAQDSLLLHLRKGRSDVPSAPARAYTPYLTFGRPDIFSLEEPNPLLLDYARAKLDARMISEKTEILRLDNEIRKQLGFKQRYGSMMQPYAMEEKESHSLTLYYEFISETEAPCCLAMEHPENCRVIFNDQEITIRDAGWYVDKAIRTIPLPPLGKGNNTVVIQMPFHQKTNLENLYILGEFDVEARPAGQSVIRAKSGKKSLGDISSQGLPFYSGVVQYTFDFVIAEPGRYAVRVPQFAASLLTVSLDGESLGQIAYAPHRLTLDELNAGPHRMIIRAFIGRHNGFGYLHNNNSRFRWFGPDAWRTAGKDWTDAYRLKSGGILSPVLIERESVYSQSQYTADGVK